MAHVPPLTPEGRLYPTSGTAAALVRGPFADAALGTLGTAHGAAGNGLRRMGKADVRDAFPRHLSARTAALPVQPSDPENPECRKACPKTAWRTFGMSSVLLRKWLPGSI